MLVNDAEKFTDAVAEMISAAVDVDKDKDGNYSLGELWKIVKVFFTNTNDVRKSWKSAVNEIRNLKSDERVKIVNRFKNKFDISNNDAEQLVEDWLDLILNLLETFERTQKMLK
jgi:nucleoid DNA-binding protein